MLNTSPGAFRDSRGTLASSSASMMESTLHMRTRPAPKRSRMQRRVKAFYDRPNTQMVVAAVISLAFTASVIQVTVEEGSREQHFLEELEVVFVVLFTVDLGVNMFGSWFAEFWRGPNWAWNWFDFVVVVVSLVSVSVASLRSMVVLRILRVFRVLRILKRIVPLRLITEGLVASLAGVTNAFVVLIIIMSIWAIIGVEFFADKMDAEFGNFLKAMLTMWQVMTTDNWCSSLARTLIFTHKTPLAAVYFVTYIFATTIIMANVVVAVLLERYLTNVKTNQDRLAAQRKAEDEIAELNKMMKLNTRRSQLVRLIRETLDTDRMMSLNLDDLIDLVDDLWSHESCKEVVRKMIDTSNEKRVEVHHSVLLELLSGDSKF